MLKQTNVMNFLDHFHFFDTLNFTCPVSGKPRRDSHSTSSDTDTDISLPSKDQDFAEITNEDLGIAEDHFSQPEVRSIINNLSCNMNQVCKQYYASTSNLVHGVRAWWLLVLYSFAYVYICMSMNINELICIITYKFVNPLYVAPKPDFR